MTLEVRTLLLCLLLSLFQVGRHGGGSVHAQTYQQNVKAVIEALAADSLQKAEDLIQQTLKLDPGRESNVVLYRYLGEIRQRRGQDDRALEAYTSGIALLRHSSLDDDKKSSLGALYLSRASLYLQRGDDAHALADYNEALTLSPNQEEALFFRAYVFARQRRNKEARADYERLLEINPMHEDARLGLAILNSNDNRPREAMEQLNSLILYFPTHARHYLARCGLYEKRKEYERAMQDVKKAIELEPENPDCYITRASLYLAMKKKDLARQDCRTAIRLGATQEQVAPFLIDTKKRRP